MVCKEIKTSKVPSSPLYSLAIEANGFVFLSGQIARDPATGKLVDGGIEAQFHCVFDNIEAILEAASLTLKNLIRVEIYLKDMHDYDIVNKLYLERMTHQPKPVRHAMQMGALPFNGLIEVTCIAFQTIR
jgi:2-iminobutanoate/2-iminopropanoate deaminase